MCFGNKFDVLKAQNRENMEIHIYTKKSEEALSVKHADFKYLLFNFHTNKFQVKTSTESRLFNSKSLLNLSMVLNSLDQALTSCIKIPQNHFVIFYQKNSNWIFDKSQ
jgi:hypothetical protein